MDIGLYFLLVLTNLIRSIKCNSDLCDEHLYESPVHKYSEQGNIKQFINMSDFSLFSNNNNILLSIISINIIPVIIIFFLIPINIFRRYEFLLTIFLSFASGGLMANVFLRLLPYINSIEKQKQSHDDRIGLFILAGIFLSFIIEKFFRYFQSMVFIYMK
jgi:hypothetical protein